MDGGGRSGMSEEIIRNRGCALAPGVQGTFCVFSQTLLLSSFISNKAYSYTPTITDSRVDVCILPGYSVCAPSISTPAPLRMPSRRTFRKTLVKRIF